MSALGRAARGALERRHLGLGLALLGVVLASPALWSGTQLDDDFHRASLMGFPARLAVASTDKGMFAFLDGDPKRDRIFKEFGFMPWWTADGIRAAFWRPVSELTHRLDYRLWPDVPSLMHLQSLLWFAFAIVAATALYRRILGASWVAGLAAFLWAVDDTHGMTIGWIANRNALVAVTFGLMTLLVHDRWRRDGWRVGAVLAPALFAVGLLSSEAALATTAYLAAHALFLDRARPASRMMALVPYAALVVAWRVAYQAMGYGASGSGIYIDPVRDPGRFLVAAAQRAPLLLEALFGAIPSDIDPALPRAAHFGFVLGSAAFVAIVLWKVLKALPGDGIARFFLTGALLSLLPVCATFPNDRLLLFAGLGSMGLIARFVGAVASGGGTSRRVGAMAVLLVGLHGVLAPLLLPLRTLTVPALVRLLAPCIEQAPSDPAIAQQTLVLVNSLEFCGAYLPLRRDIEGRPYPARVVTLTTGVTSVSLLREDVRTLVVRSGAGLFSRTSEQLLRDPGIPWVRGQRIELPDVSIEIRELTPDGFPKEVAFRWEVPLEDSALRWYATFGGRLVPFVPPAMATAPVDVPGALPF